MKYVNKGIEAAHYDAMYLSLFVATLGILLSIIIYYLQKLNAEKISILFNKLGLYSLSRNKFYIDKIYNKILYTPFMKQTKLASFIDWDIYDQKIVDAGGWITLGISKISGNADYNILDQKIIDGTSHLTNFTSKKLKVIQSGIIQNYLLGGFMCLVIIFLLIQQFN